MFDTLTLVSFLVDAAALVTVVIGLLLTLSNRIITKWFKRCFSGLFAIMIFYVCCNIVSNFFYQFSHMSLPMQTAIFLESLSSAVAMPILTIMLFRLCGENYKKSPLFYTVIGLFTIYCGLLIYTQFTKDIYYITPDNEYIRGKLYPVLLIPAVLIMIVLLIGLYRRRKKITKKNIVGFAFYITAPMISMVIQMFLYGIPFIVLGSAISCMYLVMVIQNEQAQGYISQKEELALKRADVAVLQMRPHFIYNTMTSIYYMIDQDTEKAQKVTLDFTNYLRKNFTAIAKNDTISFKEELEHTKAYLAVEQVRFEDSLFVEFNTPHTGFRLPPLTLQPIVENSVKHGVDPELKPLYISIITRKVDNGSEVIVEDTGAGFKETDNDEPHIGLKNIRERLELMCNGTLKITPREGGGTVVKLFIPDKKIRTD